MATCTTIKPKPVPRMPAAVRDIITRIAHRHGFEPEEVVSDARTAELVAIRIEIIRELCQIRLSNGDRASTTLIGGWLRRDHTTIVHHIHRAGIKRAPSIYAYPSRKPVFAAAGEQTGVGGCDDSAKRATPLSGQKIGHSGAVA